MNFIKCNESGGLALVIYPTHNGNIALMASSSILLFLNSQEQ